MMLPINHQIKHCQALGKTLIPWQNPFISAAPTSSSLFGVTQISPRKITNKLTTHQVGSVVKAILTGPSELVTIVKAVVVVKLSIGGILYKGLDELWDALGKSILLELVSAELDDTGSQKPTIKACAHKQGRKKCEVKYKCEFKIPEDFGQIGAVLVENEHIDEMFISSISFDGLVDVTCNSWVPSMHKSNSKKRIFFTNKSYLPSQTPSGLKRWREIDLEEVRGTGQGVRKKGDRIYDYDVYNDLGNPDANPELKRPVLGGKKFPYPRRCRTGHPPCKTDHVSESKSTDLVPYVPRDEEFSEVKDVSFGASALYSLLHTLIPLLEAGKENLDLGFTLFSKINDLFNEGVNIPGLKQKNLGHILPRLVKDALKFETPDLFDRDTFSWFRDEEFSRQTLAGLNPCTIQLVTEWPLMSKLDPEIYGPAESAITKELVEKEMKDFMTVEEAVEQKKLFVLDYHDLLMPYVNKVRKLKGTTLYGSRTLFFLTPSGTLMPLAIELTRPPIDNKPQWRQVFRPTLDATRCWLWRLAKTHVLAHDSGYHQLVKHWLETHCVTEPYIIASNRQLSAMHPIYRLLKPHFRYTMELNALARQLLINADGTIESSFSPGKYSMELSSVAYDKLWRFDLQALPADLVNRGMAVKDPNSPHGLKLTIEDYPYANDGLILWDAIKQWVSDYVNHYYPDSTFITSDKELHEWWQEIINVGHGDKKHEPWWPKLKTQGDLIGILTTMIWVASGQHSAVNFGQYGYGGYFPNRPRIARENMPTENPSLEELKTFIKKPESSLLKCFPSQLQALKVMAVVDTLSSHSLDEEYVGENINIEPAWGEDPVIKAAFERFSGKLTGLDRIIDARNDDWDLKNRCGAGVVPYELLKPFSGPGVTGKGVPNSISI